MAGRKNKNTVDYFPHYCIPGKTLFIIESKFGHKGYSIWFKTLELLGISENHYIDLREETDLLFLISKLKITEDEFNDIYDLLSKLDAIDEFLWSNKIIFSENFINNVADAYRRRDNKCMHLLDLCQHLGLKYIQKSNKSNHKKTKKSKVNNSIVKETKEKEKFDLVRVLYPGTKRGLETEFDNFVKKHKDWKEILPFMMSQLEEQIEIRAKSTGFVPQWANFSTWINQRKFEEELKITKNEQLNKAEQRFKSISSLGSSFAKENS